MSWRTLEPENTSNPYDSFGLYHNEALDYVSSGFLKLPIRPSNNEAMGVALSKMVSDFLYMKSGANDIFLLEDIVNSCCIALGRAMSNRDATALIHLKVDAELVKYYGDLRLLLPNTKGDNVLDTLSAIRSLESTIDSMGVSTDEKRMAYWMSSVARFSLAYWVTEGGNEDSLWIATTARINGWENMPLKSAEGPPQWVIDDIESALIGAFFTANPFAAIAGAAVNSAFQELKRHGSGAGWW